MRGYFGIGIENTKTHQNIGTLWRSASIMGAAFMFTIGKRYKKQPSDTMQSWRHIPLYNYATFEEFYRSMPYDCRLVGIELDDRSVSISGYKHHERCIYILGAEDNGLSKEALTKCHEIVQLPGDFCLNVSVAGSIVMFDRINKSHERLRPIPPMV
jgi:tRNA G18 (ribose-2'-O)-methylase SpoU